MQERAEVRWRGWRLLAGVSGLALVVMTGAVIAWSSSDYYLKINKGIDIFGRVYKEITAHYVDQIDPERLMQAGISGMLGSLDPYTVYIDRDDADEVDLMTTGRYGGIGITIGQRDGAVQVITVMDGYSAQRQGVLPGDRIIEVDGVRVMSRKPDEVRGLTRGEPGTGVRILIERDGERQPLEFVLVREEIQIKNVTYAGFIEDGIAYIKLERFSRRAGEELRQALKELKLKGDISGIILDVRGNPGGLLDAAVDVVSKFVPRGSLIVSTRGRRPEAERQYTSTEEPLMPTEPLVVLIDQHSASASEIVCGALQDLDRAVLIGTRTFGKGLVQTISRLSYGAQLKITTARYYIPSGRSIQEIDYMQRDRTGIFAAYPDSVRREFTTANGRRVYEHGGISPDSSVTQSDPGPMVKELLRKSMFLRFVNRYAAGKKGTTAPPPSPQALEAFHAFLTEQQFDFQEESELKIRELRDLAGRLHYSKEVVADLDALTRDLAREKDRAFERYKDHITRELEIELAARANGERGRIEASFGGDIQLQTALAVLRNPAVYAMKLK